MNRNTNKEIEWKKEFIERFGIMVESYDKDGMRWTYGVPDEKENKKMLNFIQELLLLERKRTLEEVIQKVRKLLVFEGVLSFSVEKAFEELYLEELSKLKYKEQWERVNGIRD